MNITEKDVGRKVLTRGGEEGIIVEYSNTDYIEFPVIVCFEESGLYNSYTPDGSFISDLDSPHIKDLLGFVDEGETHTTRDGTKILIKDMENKHLINSIRLIKKAAQRGVLVEVCGESWGEPFYGMEVLYGQEAEEHLNLHKYLEEANRRNILYLELGD